MSSEQELQPAALLTELHKSNEMHPKLVTQLLESYKTLKKRLDQVNSDLEEERYARERYKQMARGQERNPFVLVLLDGDGYVFDDDLISGGAEGGQKAAALLNAAVKRSLRSHGLEECTVMVRIYANVAGLSKALSKVKLAGPEKRSLGPFVASFNRSMDLFDFVDAGELKENADFKIKAMFRQFVEMPQCRRIYLGVCHDVGYVSDLTEHSGNRDRFTLLRTAAFHPEFTKLGMRVEDFSNIFRGTPLDTQSATSSIKTAPTQTFAQSPAPTNDGSQAICTFYQKGLCKYGNGCKFLHVKKNANGISTNGSGSTDWRSPRQNSTGDQSGFQTGNVSKSDTDFMRHSSPVPLPADLESRLPEEGTIPPGNVPVNKDHQRLDAYLQATSTQERSAFNTRVHIQKLCNNYHLKGQCPNGDNCPYDHSRISPSELKCLRQVIRNNPCPRKGSCRVMDCLNGHICQKPDCRYRGGSNFCKIPAYIHNVDLKFAGYEPANMPARDDSIDTIDEPESMESESLKGTTPPPGKTKSPKSVEFGTENESQNGNEHESDGEPDGEGALLDLDDRPQD